MSTPKLAAVGPSFFTITDPNLVPLRVVFSVSLALRRESLSLESLSVDVFGSPKSL